MVCVDVMNMHNRRESHVGVVMRAHTKRDVIWRVAGEVEADVIKKVVTDVIIKSFNDDET